MKIIRRFPAEWEPQAGVMLGWPHPHSDWAPNLETVQRVFIQLATEIASREKLLINCFDATHRSLVRSLLANAGVNMNAVHMAVCTSNDTWARDYGPVTVVDNGETQLLDFTFNGWAGKHPAELDNAISHKLASQGLFGKTPLTAIDLVLEGGSIDTDGMGTLLTTSSCLLHPGRNPGSGRQDIENTLRETLGIKRILWLENGSLIGDDTDGHIDMLARFCNVETIVYQGCDETDYPAFEALHAMSKELENLRTSNGSPYRLIRLPWPGPSFNQQGERLPASYTNFLIINDAVLVPVYNAPTDDSACNSLQSVFTDREIVPIHCRPLIEQFGSLHCVTMQLPAGVDLTFGK